MNSLIFFSDVGLKEEFLVFILEFGSPLTGCWFCSQIWANFTQKTEVEKNNKTLFFFLFFFLRFFLFLGLPSGTELCSDTMLDFTGFD
jgi:hypothetical protein